MRNPLPAIRARARPIRPTPIKPRVFPDRSLPIQRGVGHAHPRAFISSRNGPSLRAKVIIKAKAPSATVSSAYSGMFTTGIWRNFAASISMASMPTPYLMIPRRRVARSITSAVIFV